MIGTAWKCVSECKQCTARYHTLFTRAVSLQHYCNLRYAVQHAPRACVRTGDTQCLQAALLVCSATAQLMHCKVCSSVVQGFRDLQEELRHEAFALEYIITTFCSHSYLSAPQRRVCYHLVPMQGDVAKLLQTSKSSTIAIDDTYSFQDVTIQCTLRRTALKRL
eukprot:13947-Heterococcus_DN1.PRE.2